MVYYVKEKFILKQKRKSASQTYGCNADFFYCFAVCRKMLSLNCFAIHLIRRRAGVTNKLIIN